MNPKPADKDFIEWLRDNLRKIVPMTRKHVETGEMHVPALFVFPMDPDISVQIISLAHYFEMGVMGKDLTALIHQQVGQDTEVMCSMMVTESYMVSAKVNDPEAFKKLDLKQTIEHAPNRKEAIVFNAIKGDMQLIAAYTIKRPENTIPETWDLLMDPAAGIIEGEGAGEGVGATVGRMILGDDERKDNSH